MISLLKRVLRKKRVRFGQIGRNVQVKGGYFGNPENIRFGNDIYIGPEAYWDALGGIDIEDNVIMGPKVVIWTYTHNYKSQTLLPYDETEILKGVRICRNVWLALGAHILPGVTVGEGAVVGMGAVVAKDVPPLALVVGNPATVVGYRDKEQYEQLARENRSYLREKSLGRVTKKHIRA